jgi:predicted NAD/FAD-binding protein
MSWSLRCDHCDLEYAGSPRGLAAQPRNLASPAYLRFVADIVRFNRIGRGLVGDGRASDLPLGDFLDRSGLGASFADHYLLPMAAAIWSTGTGPVREFPLGTLLTFFDNHGLLGVSSHHPWRTVRGGSASYIPGLVAPLAGRVHLDVAVVAVERDSDGVTVRTQRGATSRFDKVVIAAHADQALGMLADPTPLEKELLGEWEYSRNDTYLHTDTSLLPSARAAWASWNYRLADCRVPEPNVSLSYWMNRLQPLETNQQYVVSLNPGRPPAESHVVARMNYAHPVYTPAAVATQQRLPELSGASNTFYAGAYHRYGFHEDGLRSAVRVAAAFGIRWPA